jgi:isopentenyldiphosphate isomerase
METEYKKSAIVLVFNQSGQMLLQLRSKNDDKFPSHWDLAVGGGIDEGEESEVAARREMQEEIGVSPKIQAVAQLHCSYPAWKPGVTRETDLWIYRTTFNGPFSPDPNEVDKVEFFSLDEVKEMVAGEEKIHPELSILWREGIVTQAAEIS